MDETVQLAEATGVKMEYDSTDKFGRVKSGYMDFKGHLIMLGESSGHSSRQKLFGNYSVRVSLDDVLRSDTGRLFLLPLFKRKIDQYYWSLLLAEKPGTGDFVRLGLVTVSLETVVSVTSSFLKKQSEDTGWEHVFYPYRNSEDDERFFTAKDFEGSEIWSVRVL